MKIMGFNIKRSDNMLELEEDSKILNDLEKKIQDLGESL